MEDGVLMAIDKKAIIQEIIDERELAELKYWLKQKSTDELKTELTKV